MTWHEIDLGRPIQGPEFEPECNPRDIVGVDVAVDAPAALVRLALDVGDAVAQVVLDPSNAYALWSALGIAIGAIGEARPGLTGVVSHGRAVTWPGDTEVTGH